MLNLPNPHDFYQLDRSFSLDFINLRPIFMLNSPLLKPSMNTHILWAWNIPNLLFGEIVLCERAPEFSLPAPSNKFFLFLIYGLVVSFDTHQEVKPSFAETSLLDTTICLRKSYPILSFKRISKILKCFTWYRKIDGSLKASGCRGRWLASVWN